MDTYILGRNTIMIRYFEMVIIFQVLINCFVFQNVMVVGWARRSFWSWKPGFLWINICCIDDPVDLANRPAVGISWLRICKPLLSKIIFKNIYNILDLNLVWSQCDLLPNSSICVRFDHVSRCGTQIQSCGSRRQDICASDVCALRKISTYHSLLRYNPFEYFRCVFSHVR